MAAEKKQKENRNDELMQEVQKLLMEQTEKDAAMREKALTKKNSEMLQSIFSELYELNLTRDRYRTLFTKTKEPKRGCISEFLSGRVFSTVDARDIEEFLRFCSLENRHRMAENHASNSIEIRTQRRSGAYKWTKLTVEPVPDYPQEEVYLMYVQDTEEQHHSEELKKENRLLRSQKASDAKYRLIVEHTGTLVLEYTGGRITMAPGAQVFSFWKNRGDTVALPRFFTQEDVYERDWPILQALEVEFTQNLRRDAMFKVRLKKQNNSYVWCRVVISVHKDADGGDRWICTVNDIDEATRAQQSLAYREQYDPLTGYANFSTFQYDAKQLLESRGEQQYSLWYSDIRNFKYINDLFGYEFGDEVLRRLANCLAAETGDGETFARVNADTFVMLRKMDSEEACRRRCEKLCREVNAWEPLTQRKYKVQVNTGIYVIDLTADQLTVSEMINRANVAEKSIKYGELNNIAFYTEEMRSHYLEEKALQADSRRALAAGEFRVFLQGQVDIQNGFCIGGAEALIRWQHAERGLISPDIFIPLFERDGTIAKLDEYVFREVCRYQADRLKRGLELFCISINVSRYSLLMPDFAEKYVAIKNEYHIPDGCLELECTESVMVNNMSEVSRILDKLHGCGFSLAMDDFGSGYSSLNALKEMNVDVLKLDMAFFARGLAEKRDRIIVSSVIAMAGALHMRVVAEGVETVDQVMLLKVAKCDLIQGYVFTKPVPMEDFADHIPIEAMLRAKTFCAESEHQMAQTQEQRPMARSRGSGRTETALCGVVHCRYGRENCSVIFANRVMQKMLDMPDMPAAGKNFLLLLEPYSRAEFEAMRPRLEAGEEIDAMLCLRRGARQSAVWLHTLLKLENGVLECVAMNLTGQKEREQDNEIIMHQRRVMQRQMQVGVAVMRTEQNGLVPEYANGRMRNMMRISAAAELWQSGEMLRRISAQQAAVMREQMEDALANGTSQPYTLACEIHGAAKRLQIVCQSLIGMSHKLLVLVTDVTEPEAE